MPVVRAADLRKRMGAFFVDNLFRGLARAGRLHPRARPERHGVSVVRDVPYRHPGDRAHRLDIWRPDGPGPHPVVLYVHGGGFRILSKDTHWLFALAFARRGYLVFNIDYRLAPRHPYPAAVEDACFAFRWVAENAAEWGGDPSRIVLAGESAGANLVTALSVAASWRREETWARGVFEQRHRPAAVIAACGMHQVSDPGRFARRRPLPALVQDRLQEVSESYLFGVSPERPGGTDLADPLLFLERGPPPERPLPPFFAFAGTRDPLLDDTRRLAAALEAHGGRCETRFYPGELHAFHAFVWRRRALESWQETFAFLEEALDPPAAGARGA